MQQPVIWDSWQEHFDTSEQTKKNVDLVGNFQDTIVPSIYNKIWNDVSLEVQKNKAKRHRLPPQETEQCLKQLCKRPYYLVSIAEKFDVKNIAEVGTAQGLQFFSFAEYASKNNGHVWSCDIQDVRNKEYTQKYNQCATYCPGDSKKMAENIPSDEKIDMFYIDGAHDYGSVVRDVVNLRKVQSENPIWVFDDFDKRFGCYYDIQRLCKMKKTFKIYRVGNAASGNPNHQVIIFGKL